MPNVSGGFIPAFLVSVTGAFLVCYCEHLGTFKATGLKCVIPTVPKKNLLYDIYVHFLDFKVIEVLLTFLKLLSYKILTYPDIDAV